MRKVSLGGIATLFALAALPGQAMASTTSTDVTGAAGAELTMVAATPAAMSFDHATTGSATSALTVTSTAASWTLSVADLQSAPTGHTAGHMDQMNGTCVSATGWASSLGELTDAMTWSSSTGSSGTLSGSAATVVSGSLVQAVTMTFNQTLAALDPAPAGSCYKLTITYTVT